MLKEIIIGSSVEPFLRMALRRPDLAFNNSGSYWEQRYIAKGNSGTGSYGRLADFKAEILNELVAKNDIKSVIEFGCGDGNQLSLASYPSYVGIDVSKRAVSICKKRFNRDNSKSFFAVGDLIELSAELTISLDVIYHLVEGSVFEEYMHNLFSASSRFVAIYSSNFVEEFVMGAEHVRHRCFTDWVKKNALDFELIRKVPNNYPYDENNPENTSHADFFIYEKRT